MNETLEILKHVNEFYISAWDKLVLIGALFVALFGLIVPLLFHLLQKQTLKYQEAEIKNRLTSELKEVVKNELNEITKKQENIKLALQGNIMHITGIMDVNKHDYDVSVMQFLEAAKRYIVAEDYLNCIGAIENLISVAGALGNKKRFESVISRYNINLNKFYTHINKYDKTFVVGEKINELKQKIASLTPNGSKT